jgi:hypothetical protein
MTSPADQISDLVPTTVLGGSSGWALKVGKMPAEPDQVVCFYDTGGSNPMPTFRLDFRAVQCMVRGKPGDYVSAYNKAQQIKDSLLGRDPHDFASGDHLSGITMLGDIIYVTQDDAGRHQFSINFRVFWEPATNALSHRE